MCIPIASVGAKSDINGPVRLEQSRPLLVILSIQRNLGIAILNRSVDNRGASELFPARGHVQCVQPKHISVGNHSIDHHRLLRLGYEVNSAAGRIDDRGSHDAHFGEAGNTRAALRRDWHGSHTIGWIEKVDMPERLSRTVGLEGVYAVMLGRDVNHVDRTHPRNVYARGIQRLRCYDPIYAIGEHASKESGVDILGSQENFTVVHTGAVGASTLRVLRISCPSRHGY